MFLSTVRYPAVTIMLMLIGAGIGMKWEDLENSLTSVQRLMQTKEEKEQ